MTSNNPFIVSKFGGNSLRDADAIRQSARLARERESSVVVVSATYGTTNQLIDLYRMAENRHTVQAHELTRDIIRRHEQLAEALDVTDRCLEQLNQLADTLNYLTNLIISSDDPDPQRYDELLALGEQLSSLLFSCAFNTGEERQATWFDVGRIMITDGHYTRSRPLFEEIAKRTQDQLLPLVQDGYCVVTQGFIGKTSRGQTTTLGRGGSDYSAALIAWALNAQQLEIWTDVAGISTTDPRIVPEARTLHQVSFKEAAEMATFGAKVLHPATITPATWRDIPVYVASSFEPGRKGTWIRRKADTEPLVRALALRRNQSLLTISTPEMLYMHGFLHRVFELFDRHRISVDSITTSEISVALTVDDDTLVNERLIKELSELGTVETERDFELVSLIGNHILHTPGLASGVFNALDHINVRMICHGASRNNFCFLVAAGQGEQAIRSLHRQFLEPSTHEHQYS